MLYSLTKIFLRGRVVHVKQHLLGQTLQLVLRMGHGGASLGTRNKKAIRGGVSIHLSVEFCLYFPSFISETAKIKAYAGEKKIH